MKHQRFTRSTTAYAAAALAVLAGCASIERAREAQSRLEPLGAGEVSQAPEKLLLRGATLKELVSFALTNRPAMASARLAVEDARLRLKEIASDAPIVSTTPWNALDVSATIGHSEQSKSAHFDQLKSQTHGSASGSLSLGLLLWDFGRNSARAKSACESVVAAEMSLVDQGYAVFEEVTSAWFELLQSDTLLEVAFADEQNYAEHLKQAEDMLEIGEAQELDVLRARLDLAKAREAVVAASNDVSTAGARMMSALGVDASRGTCDEVLGHREVDFEKFRTSFAETDASSESVFALARTNTPSMAAVRAKLRAASSDVDYAVRDLYPEISATLSLNWTDPLWYWRWGFSGVQSLFSGFKTTVAIDRSLVALETAANAVLAQEQDLSRDVEIAVAERDNSREAYASAEVSVASAKENLSTVSGRYAVGEASRVDYTDAAADYTDALGARVKAFYRGQIAESKLFRLTGSMPVYVGGVENKEPETQGAGE